MAQPAGGGFFIGQELVDPAWKTHATDALCPTGKQCRLSDAALFKYDSVPLFSQGKVALPSIGSTTFSTTTTITEQLAPVVGWPAHMIGKSSGHTSGTIVATCTDLTVYDNGIPTNFVLRCQSMATYSSQAGDSGAPIIEPVGDGTQAFVLGVHWGSQENTNYGLFSAIQDVLGEIESTMTSLGSLDPTAPPPPPPPPPPPISITLSGPGAARSGATCLWTATPTTGVSPYTYAWSINSIPTGNGSSYPNELIYTNSGSAFTVGVLVTDAVGTTGTKSKSVTISGTAPVCPY